ncbi:MAG TPA: outer membrane protein assembly factor BamD [Chitinophagaceae bacterium]|nr:outer membrane protein assembly factor BamD [Chitinophagaceae bacterium]
MNQRKYITGIIGILILSMTVASCSKFNRIRKSNDNEKILNYANDLFKEEKYKKAQELYDLIKNSYKATKKYEQISYNYVYTYYYLQNYTSAAFYFKNFVQVFPKSDKREEMAFMQAYCFYKLSPRPELDQTDTKKAISAMQTFINIYPKSDSLQKATKIIDKLRGKLEKKAYKAAKLYFGLEYYEAAGVSFNNLLLDYPSSEKGDMYKFMAVKSYYEYADHSIFSKQKIRYQKVISQYRNFEEFYPNSPYLEEAKSYYHSAKKDLDKLEQLTEKRKKILKERSKKQNESIEKIKRN